MKFNENFKPIHTEQLRLHFDDFLKYKRAIGYKYETEEKVMRSFIRYCQQNFPSGELPDNVVYDWINLDDNRSQKTKANQAIMLSEWAKYMFSLGYIPLRIPEIRSPKHTAFIPHIFTDQELEAFWAVADNLKYRSNYPNMHKCVPVLFRLLYSCGLRIHEALCITTDDIDFEKNVITIRHAKLDKDRWIPMGSSMAAILKKYVDDQRDRIPSDAPIFYYRKSSVLTEHSVYGKFRIILNKSGIPYEGRLRGPRVHDFRHTFAVRAMNKMTDSGQDLYVALPILSAYLGHASIESTERYIRLTADRLSTITESMQLHLPDIFPEVAQDEEF